MNSLCVSPNIGLKNGNSQNISVYDKSFDVMRTITTTPEKIDAFTKERKESLNDSAVKGLGVALGTTALYTGLGALVSRHRCRGRNMYIALMSSAGLLLGSCIAGIMKESADKKVTDKFIKENS